MPRRVTSLTKDAQCFGGYCRKFEQLESFLVLINSAIDLATNVSYFVEMMGEIFTGCNVSILEYERQGG